MSIPDKTSVDRPDTAAKSGINAYKINRCGLEPPVPSRADVRGAPLPGVMPARRKSNSVARAAAVAVCAVIGLAVALVYGLRARQGASSALPLVRGDAQRAAAMPAYRALVIGINRYQQSAEGWQALHSARADAEAIAETLSSDYGFSVKTLLDGEATRSNILNALDEMATTGQDGADLIYFAGHGYYDDKLQEGYWIPADARKTVGGRQAKEDWLWNSTITRLVSASPARHILVMSDACYSGSLFRGDGPLRASGNQSWYERAIAKPSRYLITSGGIEPVLDSGAGHSVFAQQVINYLTHGDRPVFSANDLGSALRERVAALTGQMVQMGPLPVSGHAGGEFVFVRRKAGVPLATLAQQSAAAAEGDTRGPDPAQAGAAEAGKSRQEALQNAVALTREGAPKAANSLVATVLQQNAQDQLARAVSDYIARSQKQEGRDELRKLIEQLEAKGKSAASKKGVKPSEPRPRVLACLGPVLPAGSDPAAESAALLCRIALRSGLESRAGLTVIEREALETVLQEQSLGVSDLADPRARLAIGKLLPASLLLLGDWVPAEKGAKVFLRLVDTETTQVVASFTATREAGEDTEKICAALVNQISERVLALRP